jgi:hypothetical protein
MMFTCVRESNSILYFLFSIVVNSIFGISVEINIRIITMKNIRNSAEHPKNDFLMQPDLFCVLYCCMSLLYKPTSINETGGNGISESRTVTIPGSSSKAIETIIIPNSIPTAILFSLISLSSSRSFVNQINI